MKQDMCWSGELIFRFSRYFFLFWGGGGGGGGRMGMACFEA